MKALIFGITGQDGSYLAELLLKKGYRVTGVTRRVSVNTTARIQHILPKIKIVEGDITDAFNINKHLSKFRLAYTGIHQSRQVGLTDFWPVALSYHP